MWIRPVAQEAQQKLSAWGSNKEVKGRSRTNIIIELDLGGRITDCDRPREFAVETDFSRAYLGKNSSRN